MSVELPPKIGQKLVHLIETYYTLYSRSNQHHLLRDLYRHAKKAKVFETQKVVKKLKLVHSKLETAASDVPETVKEARQKELKKCERDVALIKHVDLHESSYSAFLKSLEFNNLPQLVPLANQEHAVIMASSEPSEPTTSTTSAAPVDAEVVARLSARIVEHMEFKRALETGVEELRKLMHQAGVWSVAREDGVKKVKLTQKERKALNKKRKLEAVQAAEEEDEESGDEQEVAAVGGKYVKAVQNDDAAAPSTQSKWVAKPTAQAKKTTPATTASSTQQPPSKKAKTSSTTTAAAKMESTFLETLGADGGLSDVEFSDFSETDEIPGAKQIENKKKKGDEPRKKKRMGQRERQALYEAQYGRQANHILNKELALVNKKKLVPAAPVDPELHPSWLARKAQKQTISEFKGSKISFGDDGVVDAPPAAAAKKAEAGAAGEESLHPSWAAKRAQKMQIAAVPVGKKITFGEEEKGGVAKKGADKKPAAPVVEENLHPSWAAKKKQSMAMGHSSGKKVVFGDDADSAEPVTAAVVAAPSKFKKTANDKKPVVAANAFVKKPAAPEPVDEKLHPSWAAKKKQSLAMGHSEGKKIVFGDD
ncbi:hypothetical protein HDU98_010036 [Podochytrium sp. JEL0797]|nr:hypothetical protein HDU98_010036 [Podochytrium sp. JEL0797]